MLLYTGQLLEIMTHYCAAADACMHKRSPLLLWAQPKQKLRNAAAVVKAAMLSTHKHPCILPINSTSEERQQLLIT